MFELLAQANKTFGDRITEWMSDVYNFFTGSEANLKTVDVISNTTFALDYLENLFSNILLPVKLFLIAFSIFLFIFIIILLMKTSFIRYKYLESIYHFVVGKPFGIKKYTKEWKKIIDLIETDDPHNYRIAIIQADDLLSEVLSQLGYKGDTIEQQLEKTGEYLISNKEDVIKAHKIREDLIYDPAFQITKDKAKEIISIYETALRDLEYI